MKRILMILASLLILIGCKDDPIENNNPFVGVWKEDVNKKYFYEDGTFKYIMNYYGDGKTRTSTGVYSYNADLKTVSFSFNGGTGRIYMLQEISKNKIVYFDPTDLETYYLVRVDD